jgi:hypothetical protein
MCITIRRAEWSFNTVDHQQVITSNRRSVICVCNPFQLAVSASQED